MSEVRTWLGARRPEPPMSLEPWLDRASAKSAEPLVQALAAHASEALRAARDRPGRVRQSAFDLLAADALLSYACEAAIEAEEPSAVLAWLLSDSASP